jgi:heme/copper-type cytochrome/quinol oxidase subunit 2
VQSGTDTVLTCNAATGVQTGPGGSNPVQTGPGGTNTGSNVTLINPLQGGTSLESFLNNILAFVIRIGTIIVILMLVYVGFLFVAARGEPAKITEARSALLWTVVGALILLGAQAIAIAITATVKALSVGG